MKRTVCLILSIILCSSAFYLLSACNKDATKDLTATSSFLLTESNQIATTDHTLYQQTSNNESDLGGGVITVQKYRSAFYSVPAPFVNLVGKEVFFAWRETIDATATAETMVMSQFVQHFGITREQFDKANLEWTKGVRDNLFGVPCINPKDYANQEDDEVYNADIIFTFDNDLIREYYLAPDYPYLYDIEFEKAVASGEYTPQTEVWVDVEQMEAEIIAKYGETEIVPEEPTNALEEIATTPEEPAVTTEDSEPTQAIKVLTDQ